MTPEASDFLNKAREFILKARDMLARWPDESGRAAYLAAFHAAQAFIFESTGAIVKTHSGVRGQFGRLVRDDARFDNELRGFLGRAYNFKTVADYETGPGADVTPERALSAIAASDRLVQLIATILDDNGVGFDRPSDI